MPKIEPINDPETHELRACQRILEMLDSDLMETLENEKKSPDPDYLRHKIAEAAGILDLVATNMHDGLTAIEAMNDEERAKRG